MNKTKSAIAFGFIAIFSVFISGQDVDAPVQVDTQLVSVAITIKDRMGGSVKGLTASQFKVFDNSTQRKIEYFSPPDAGVAFGVVYDMHPTTAEHTKAALAGLGEFAKGLSAKDDFFVVMFNERGTLVADVVPDFDQLERHLARPEKREPRSLYDALLLATDKLRERKNVKRTLLVITDAADHNSRRSLRDLQAELRKFDLRVYAIVPDRTSYGYLDLNDDQEARLWSDATASDRANLNSIMMRSGGTMFPASLRHEASIAKVLGLVSAETHDQYTIGFYSADPPDGKWHDLTIRLDAGRAGKNYVLTYRLGYQSRNK